MNNDECLQPAGSIEMILPESLTIFDVKSIYAHWKNEWRPADNIQVDCSAVDEIDGAGIQLLVWLFLEYQRQGASLVLLNMPAQIQAALSLYQLPFPWLEDGEND